MKKGSLTSIITFLVIFIIYLTLFVQQSSNQEKIENYKKELSEIREQKINFSQYLNQIFLRERLKLGYLIQNETRNGLETNFEDIVLKINESNNGLNLFYDSSGEKILIEINLNYTNNGYNEYVNDSRILIDSNYDLKEILNKIQNLDSDFFCMNYNKTYDEGSGLFFKTAKPSISLLGDCFIKYLFHTNNGITKYFPVHHYNGTIFVFDIIAKRNFNCPNISEAECDLIKIDRD